jgi:glutathione synthase/RimK-type ligase-like ATP-grasp enzyme
VAQVIWDDPAVDWAAHDLVVVRSTWDSVDRPEAFLAWVDSVPAIANPAPMLRWNLDKRHLRDLPVPAVPTAWVAPGDGWAPPGGDFVVKPMVSAGGRETARYQPHEEAVARAHVARLHAGGHTAMVQAYVPEVDDPGELKVVFVDGELSHAVRVRPLLARGRGVEARPWERDVGPALAEVGPEELAAAERTIAYVTERFGEVPLYARVDLAGGVVMELELVEPFLFLGLHPPAADRLAAAIRARL